MLHPAPKIQFYTARDGYRLATRVWEADAPPAHVVYLHGIVSHGGWYLSSCAHLAKEGFAVSFLDRRGSGLNHVRRGDVDQWPTWLDDVVVYLEQLPTEMPKILLGISWGGTLAAAVARRNAELLGGLGLLCPGLFSRKAPNPFQRTAVRTARKFGLGQARVGIPLRDPALFTNGSDAQTYIDRDPLTLWTITMSFAAANLELARYATARPEDIRVPTLLLLAEQDPITKNDEVLRFVEHIGHPEKQVIVYAGASHTLEFEPDTSQYFADLAAWCRSIADGTSRS